jgi:Uma2 family endonuclease
MMNPELNDDDILIEPEAVDEIALPPTQDELPCDDGVPMETARHRMQMELLINTLEPWLAEQQTGYVGGNMFLYFSMEQVRNRYFRGPDFFAVLGVSQKERKSWVVWEEKKAPDVIIELLSESTAENDKTSKKIIYQDQLRIPEYFWFDPFNPDDWAGFALRDGIYELLPFDLSNRLVSHRLGLALTRWPGIYRNVEAVWLRWETLEGVLLPTDEEAAKQRAKQAEQQADQEKQRAEQEKQRAEGAERQADQEKQWAEKLAAKLRALGFDPD